MTLTRENVQQKIQEIFIEVFELSPELLKPEAKLYEDLGLDSIDAIDLAIAFERKFNVKVDQEMIKTIRTLDDVYKTAFENQNSAFQETSSNQTPPVSQ